jgi:hypothetical protein
MLNAYIALTIVCCFSFPGRLIAAATHNSLSFYRVLDDPNIYKKNPAKYDRIVHKDSKGEYDTYVERQPAHVIPEETIKSVIIRKTKVYGNLPTDRFYDATFTIASREAKKFIDFTDKNKQDRFELKFGKRSLGIIQFGGDAFEANKNAEVEFTAYLSNTLNQLKEIFSPLKNRLAWEIQ